MAAQPIVSVSAELLPYTLAGDILFEATLGGTYVLLSSDNLCNWKEVRRVRSATDNILTNITVDTTAPRGYWRIYRFEDFQPEE